MPPEPHSTAAAAGCEGEGSEGDGASGIPAAAVAADADAVDDRGTQATPMVVAVPKASQPGERGEGSAKAEARLARAEAEADQQDLFQAAIVRRVRPCLPACLTGLRWCCWQRV